MIEYSSMTRTALVLVGLTNDQIRRIEAGGEIYGERGELDSLALVQFIAALGSQLEENGIEIFDVLYEMDASPETNFRTMDTTSKFLSNLLAAPLHTGRT